QEVGGSIPPSSTNLDSLQSIGFIRLKMLLCFLFKLY
ncbi:uncharacterized protein METZ01_LOCUS457563, partial [marine metagenome]